MRLSSVSGHEQQHQPNVEPSSPSPAPSTSSSISTESPRLMRRLRSRLISRRPAARTQAASRPLNENFNPEATEFIPSPRMPPKRKASSMGRSGKAVLSIPHNDSSSSQSSDQPIVRSDEVFGRSVLTRNLSDAFDGIVEDEDIPDGFDFETMGFANDAMSRDRARMSEALSVMRSRVAKAQRTPDLIQSNSAILFSYEGEGSTAGDSDDSSRLRYLPLCPATTSGWRDPMGRDTPLTILPRHRERIDELVSTPHSANITWPPNKLPIELFDLITSHLSRDAVKSMRLVNSEFEQKVSCTLFHTSVVPFNTELYDMIDEDTRAASRASRRAKGKGKAGPWDIPGQRADPNYGSLHWTNAKFDAEGKVYKGHGLRVFQGFGPHIRRFGMSFDVLESQLSRPPIKRELDHVDSYHGSYDWPPVCYTRFANLAGLEKTADETLRMKSAFSHLNNVHDLAISVDSGLGWLNGPDKSIHARVFQRQSPIFGHSRLVADHQTQDANEFWATVQSCNRSLGNHINPKEISLIRRPLGKDPSELSGLRGTRYGDRRLWSSIASNRAAPTISTTMSEDIQCGIMYTTCATPDSSAQSMYDKSALVPSELRKEQKEWLLETEWAQRAFLECYMLAVMDNPDKFVMVKTLAVAKVSSGFLPLLARESFWDALPNLEDVTILVKPDWRSVERDNAGFAETCPQNPSEAVRTFHRCILRDRLCLREGIKKLNIGWSAGGEHADGIFARNTHIMPAPITELEHTTAASVTSGLVFKFVEQLTLTNCWITPPMLEDLVKSHAERSLKVLTLDSVSLTAHPRFPAGGQAVAHQHIAQAIAGFGGMQGGGAPNAAQVNQPNAQNVLVHQHQHAPAPPPWAVPNAVPPQGNNQHQQLLQNLFQQQGNQFGNAGFANNANIFGAVQAPVFLAANHAVANPNVFGIWPPAAHGNGVGWQMPLPPPLNAPAPQVQPPNTAALATQNTHTNPHWTTEHREGSWPEVLNSISPGVRFVDYQPQPAPWEEQHAPRAPTALQKIELKSCGYAKLYHSTAFDQFAVEAGHDHHLSLWFRNRQAALSPAMLTTTDRYLGRIMQHMPSREQDALLYAWGLTMGWSDHSKAEEAEYDGLLAGGTGRFSGTISKGMEPLGQQQV